MVLKLSTLVLGFFVNWYVFGSHSRRLYPLVSVATKRIAVLSEFKVAVCHTCNLQTLRVAAYCAAHNSTTAPQVCPAFLSQPVVHSFILGYRIMENGPARIPLAGRTNDDILFMHSTCFLA